MSLHLRVSAQQDSLKSKDLSFIYVSIGGGVDWYDKSIFPDGYRMGAGTLALVVYPFKSRFLGFEWLFEMDCFVAHDTTLIGNENSYYCQWGANVDSTFDGIGDLKPESVNLYPNPAFDRLMVQSDRVLPERLIILDGQGRIVGRLPTNGMQCEINVSQFSPGMYFIKWPYGAKPFLVVR